MAIMSKLTASYLAGLIDGDGCLEILKKKKPDSKYGIYYMPRIRIGSVRKEIIDWLKNSFGGYVSKDEIKERMKQVSWEWCLQNTKNVEPFIKKVSPYLKIKKKQGEVLKEFLKTYKDSSYRIVKNSHDLRNGGTGMHRELKDEVLEKREKLHRQIRNLSIKSSAR